MGISCGTAVLSAAVVVGAGAAAPGTGGLSGFALVVAWGNAASSAMACGMDVTRVIHEYHRPGSADQLDRSLSYRVVRSAVDVTAFATGVASLPGDVRTVTTHRGLFSSGRRIGLEPRARSIATPPDHILRMMYQPYSGFAPQIARTFPIYFTTNSFGRLCVRIGSVVGNFITLSTSSVTRDLVLHLLRLA